MKHQGQGFCNQLVVGLSSAICMLSITIFHKGTLQAEFPIMYISFSLLHPFKDQATGICHPRPSSGQP